MNGPHTEAPTAPQRVIGCYPNYRMAERAVDFLSGNRFPVERTVIVGRGLDLVERITRRRPYWTAAAGGAGTGAIVGALFGWLFAVIGWVAPLITELLLAFYGALFGALIGAVAGALLGLIGHAATGGQRDFSSAPRFQARSYDVLVDDELAEEATGILTTAGGPGVGDRPY